MGVPPQSGRHVLPDARLQLHVRLRGAPLRVQHRRLRFWLLLPQRSVLPSDPAQVLLRESLTFDDGLGDRTAGL